MMWFFAVLVVLVMGGVAMVASGRGGSMPPAYDDRPDLALPDDRPVAADDLRRVRFPLAFRGYRMSEVDALLERLSAQVDAAGPDDEQPAEPVVEAPAEPVAEAPTAPPVAPAPAPADHPATEGRGDRLSD